MCCWNGSKYIVQSASGFDSVSMSFARGLQYTKPVANDRREFAIAVGNLCRFSRSQCSYARSGNFLNPIRHIVPSEFYSLIGFIKKQKDGKFALWAIFFARLTKASFRRLTLKCEPDSVLCTERVHLQVGSTNAKSTPKGAF